MTSSSSSSGRRLGLALLALAALAACRHGPLRPAAPPARLAVFPVQNACGCVAPVRALTEALDEALAARGLPVVPRAELDAALARSRIRFTGGVDRAGARVMRDELGADAVLVPTLEQYSADEPPRVALGVRVVRTGERPVVAWADSVARSGDDAPGLLGLGRVARVADLERAVVGRVAGAVQAWALAGTLGPSCGGSGRFGPRRTFRAPLLDDVGRRTIAVLPFTNETQRRDAGEVLHAQFVAELARSGAFEVIDPGAVREELLGNRIVLEGGVSVDAATALLALLNADLVLSGYVQEYETPVGPRSPPKVAFTAFVIDRRTAQLVWSSASDAGGSDGVWFFDAGRVETGAALSCRMVGAVVDRLSGFRQPLAPWEAP